MLDSFFLSGELPVNAEEWTYHVPLVFLSYAIAVFSSWTALSLSRQLTGRRSRLLLWGGSFALGAGIWSMHFVGMLSYNMRMLMSYDPFPTVVSLAVAIAAAYGVLSMMSRERLTLIQIWAGALILGTGISAMHYIGMSAMHMDATLRYIPHIFLLSVAVAVVASAAALWIAFSLARHTGRTQHWLQTCAALIMGAGICGMHYTGMAAAVFVPYADCRLAPEQNFDMLAVVITFVSGLILLTALTLDSYQQQFLLPQNRTKNLLHQSGPFIIILLFGATLAFLIHQKSARDYDAALENYRKHALGRSEAAAYAMEEVLGDIYRDIRTISLLPSIRNIDRHAKNISADAYQTINQLYDNLRHNVSVSEIYIVPADFNSSALDPATGHPQEPILAFDRYIAAGRPEKNIPAPEEVEIHEYRQLDKTTAWFRAHYPSLHSLKGGAVPIVSGASVMTCDNTLYRTTLRDKDRMGVIFSVPFYGTDGALRGLVSAIIRLDTLSDILPEPDYALINKSYGIAISKDGGQDERSASWIEQVKPDPDLLYSRVFPLDFKDGQSNWSLWSGFPNAAFLDSGDARAVRNFEWAGYGLVLFLTAGGIGLMALMRRNFRLMRANNTQLSAWLESERSQKAALTAKEVAERSNAVKSEFLANMSHELRTPLNSILGMLRLLMESEMGDEQRLLAGTAFRSSANLLEIVNDILDLSKIEAGEMHLEHIGMDLSYVLHSVVHAMDHLAREKRITIVRNYEKESFPYVLGDPTRLSRMLLNLIGNALKYTHDGHVEVDVTCKKTDDTHVAVRCAIKDTGIGIPAGKHKEIFEKFSQADSSTTRKYGGTGLGLAITRELTEMMHGTIGVESVEGEGSTFWFEIPFEVTDKPHDEKMIRRRKMKAGTIPAAGVRILVAEDHPMNQLLITKILQRFGIRNFEIVEDGLAALQRSAEKEFDIILMDCHMPELNGYDTTEKIRLREKTAGGRVPIIAMTANAMVGDREKCLRYGMDEYVSKPISIEELEMVLGQWVLLDDSRAAPPAAAAGNAPVDLSRLDGLTGGDRETQRELVKLFIEQSDMNAKILSENQVDGACAAWAGTAHTLKGAAVNLGAQTLGKLCDKAQYLEDCTAAERRDILEKISAEYARVRSHLLRSFKAPDEDVS